MYLPLLYYNKYKNMIAFQPKLSSYLYEWKLNTKRKPLIVRGARQVGKTTLIRQFATSYSHSISLNLEKEADKQLFETQDEVKTMVENLFLTHNIASEHISNTLLFIDEIQESPKAIQLLRYFYEEIPQLHVIAAGSLLEFALNKVKSFPVGRVEFLYLYPLNFAEYLSAIQHQEAVNRGNLLRLSRSLKFYYEISNLRTT